MNELLTYIDQIDTASCIAEMETLNALCDSYIKASMIIEAVDESTDTSSFSIFQELNTDTLKDAFRNFMYTDGTMPHGKPGESVVKKILLFIPRLFLMFLRQLMKLVVFIVGHLVDDIISIKDDKYRYLPIDPEVFRSDILNQIDNLISLFKDVHEHVPNNCDSPAKYYSILVSTVIDLTNGFEIPTVNGKMKNATMEIALDEFAKYLKQYDDGGSKHKKLFKETKENSPQSQEYTSKLMKKSYHNTVRELKNLIKRLNYVNKNFKQQYEQDEAMGDAYRAVNKMRSNLAYILQFLAKISTTCTEYSNKHKLNEYKDSYRYDSAEFDDDYNEEES